MKTSTCPSIPGPPATVPDTCAACLPATNSLVVPRSGASMSTPSKWVAKASRPLVKHSKTPPEQRPTTKRHVRPPSLAATRALLVAALWLCGACVAPATESGGATAATNGVVEVHNRADSGGQTVGLAGTVERVVDGDTIIVNVNNATETVRLLGIDTPEKPGGPRPAECFGTDASAYIEELLPAGEVVLLTRDSETRDQYGRLLAFVHRADDGLFVNEAMLTGGYATPLFFAPNTSLEAQFTAAANTARRNWVGFWPACGAADEALRAPS